MSTPAKKVPAGTRNVAARALRPLLVGKGSTVLYDAAGPRAAIRNLVISIVTIVVAAWLVVVVLGKLDDRGQLTAAKWEPFTTANLWRTYILPGIEGTLTAAAISIVLAGLLGVLLGVGRLSSVR